MLHVLKRLVLMVVGYLVGVVIALVAVVIIYAVLTTLPDAPSYFSAMTLSPLVVLLVPPVGMIVLLVVLILTSLPALVAGLVAEFFSLRQIWLFGLIGAAIGGAAFVYASPQMVGTIAGTDWADLAIVTVSGAIGGLTYWLIAGRNAGFPRPAPSPLPA